MSAYVDTSVLAAYYLPEALSESAERVLARIAAPAISALIDVEFVSVVARKVRTAQLSSASAREVLRDYDEDRSAGRYRLADIRESHYAQARRWIASLAVPLRTLDALHLALAHEQSIPLLTADRQLARAASKLAVRFRLVSA